MQLCQSRLTDYCREEFGKFRTLLTKKSAEIGQFSGEKGRFGCFLRSYLSAVIG